MSFCCHLPLANECLLPLAMQDLSKHRRRKVWVLLLPLLLFSLCFLPN